MSKTSTTDSSISTGLRGGLILDDDGGAAEARADNFEIDDNVAAGAEPPERRRPVHIARVWGILAALVP